MRPLDDHIRTRLTQHLDNIGNDLDTDMIAIVSPIVAGLENRLRDAIDKLATFRKSVAII